MPSLTASPLRQDAAMHMQCLRALPLPYKPDGVLLLLDVKPAKVTVMKS